MKRGMAMLSEDRERFRRFARQEHRRKRDFTWPRKAAKALAVLGQHRHAALHAILGGPDRRGRVP